MPVQENYQMAAEAPRTVYMIYDLMQISFNKYC